MHTRAILSGLFLCLSACGGATTDGPGTHAPLASASTTSTAPGVASGAPVAAPAEALHAVLQLDEHASAVAIYAVKGAVILTYTMMTDADGGQRTVFERIDGDALVDIPDAEEPPQFMSSVVSVGGAWPDRVIAASTYAAGRTGAGMATNVVVGKGLKKSGCNTGEGAFAIGTALTGDTVLSVFAPAMMNPSSVDICAAIGAGPVPTPAPADKAYCAKTFPDSASSLDYMPPTAVIPTAFGATDDGVVLSLGTRCMGSDTVVEAWPKGEKRSSITSLPGAGDVLVTGRSREAWIVGAQPYHFDGSTWTLVPNAPLLRSAALAPDGTLWGIDGQKLWRGGVNGFSEVKTTTPVETVVAADDGAVWFLHGNTLLRTRKTPDEADAPPPVVPLVTRKAAAQAPKVAVTTPGPDCENNVVILYGFTKMTPADYDFPLTRKALAGHSELADMPVAVTKDGDHKFLTALARTFDEAKAVAAIIEKGVKGSKPQIVCRKPDVVRELKFDRTTGAVVK